MADINKTFSTSKKLKQSNKTENMLQFISSKFQMSSQYDTRMFRRKWLDSAKNLYQKDLVAHYGCVNAIEFSEEGDLLFSGGDDRQVIMWKVDDAMAKEKTDLKPPTEMKATHASNVFCLAVDTKNKRVLSGGNDYQVITHDYSNGKPVNNYLHESPIFCISLTPDDGEVYVVATDDGKILLIDPREPAADPAVCVASFSAPFHGVMHHPLEPAFVATANAKFGIHIWDVRKPLEPIQQCSEQGMAVRWNYIGSRLLCMRNLLPPMLLDPTHPERHLEFDASSYYIACTMKSCCFAGDRDEYILSGSDDFNVYMWNIPEPWPESNWVGSEHIVLQGHRSIVNQVRYCPGKQLIASSGVEKVIKLWSPDEIPSSYGDRDVSRKKRARLLCSAQACSDSSGVSFGAETLEEDFQMLHFFDSLLRDEFTSFPSAVGSGSPELEENGPLNTETRRYNTWIRRKKKFILKNMKEPKPNICSICDAILLNPISLVLRGEEGSDVTADSSDDSGMNPSRTEQVASSASSSSSSSPSCVIYSSDSEDSAPSNKGQLKDSGVNLSPSSEDDLTEVVRRRVNQSDRCYRIKSRRPCPATSSDSSSSESNDDNSSGRDT